MANEPNPAFNVEIAVDAAYRMDPLQPGQEAPEGAVVVQTISGPCVRNLLTMRTKTVIGFGADSITSIQRDQVAANMQPRTANAIIAQHIQDAAMRDHSPVENWLAIRCEQDPGLEAFLKAYFSKPDAWPTDIE